MTRRKVKKYKDHNTQKETDKTRKENRRRRERIIEKRKK